MHTSMRILVILISMAITTLSAQGAESIPKSVIGIWALENSEFQGHFLIKGEALYLGDDGVGAIVGGPPPIGFKIIATFNVQTNQIEFDGYEGNVKRMHGVVQYDPKREVIFHSESPTKLLRRISDRFADENKRALGM